ncbi:MAG: hypothetical protein ABIG93_05860 [archaeon]
MEKNVAVVGYGYSGGIHASLLQRKIAGANLVAVCDLDSSKFETTTKGNLPVGDPADLTNVMQFTSYRDRLRMKVLVLLVLLHLHTFMQIWLVRLWKLILM